MTKLSTWTAHSSIRTLDISSSLVPKVFVSRVQPSASELAAVAAKEQADGWPTPTVERNTARRLATFDLFFGSGGLTLGTGKPPQDVTPGLVNGMGSIRAPKGPRHLFRPDDGSLLSMYSIYTAYVRDDQALVRLARSLMGPTADDLVFVDVVFEDRESTSYSATSVVTAINAGTTGAEGSGFLYVGISLVLGSVTDPATHALVPSLNGAGIRVHCVLRFAKGSLYPGINGLYYRPCDQSGPFATNTVASKTGWELARMWADKGATRYLAMYHPDTVIQTPSLTAAPLTSSNSNGVMHTIELIEQGVNPEGEVDWWGLQRSLFEVSAGFHRTTVYAIGNPEFVTGFSVVGSVVKGDSSAAISAADLVFDWSGKRLGDIKADLSAEDRARLEELTITTVVYGQGRAPAIANDLSQLKMAKKYAENDESISDKVYMPARVEDGESLPAVTFAEAAARAGGLDMQIWHRQTGSTVEPYDVDYVDLSGSPGNTTARAYLGATMVSDDPDYCLMCVAQGADLQTFNWVPSGFDTDAAKDLWDSTLQEILDRSGDLAIRFEFDESTAYGPGAPFMSKLSAGEKVAMSLAQGVLSRKELSSFVVGSAVMAANARRVLC